MKSITVIAGFLATFLLSSLIGLGQSQSRSDMLKELQAKRAELAVLEKNFLEPGAEDRLRYADFLDQPDTGLIRLLPREKFDTEVYKNNKQTVAMRGGGAYYSFPRKTHVYGHGSDIELEQGHLKTGFAGADFGMLTDLGDIPLENVGAQTSAVTVFAAYQPPRQEQLARREYQRLAQGAELERLPVKSRVPLTLSSTYLLRSINYLQSDVLVALKVVRIDSDGSAIIAWKLLKSYAKPKFTPAEVVEIK
jgi:hypothetical protein